MQVIEAQSFWSWRLTITCISTRCGCSTVAAAPQGQGGADATDLLEELHRQDRDADRLLVGRQTFEDLRGYWPTQSDDTTGITDYLDQVQKYVVSSTMTDPGWQNSTVLSGDPV